MANEFIRVMKVINGAENKHRLEPDNIDVADIKSFRNWNIDPNFTDYAGDCCLVSIKSESSKEGFYTIKIAENEDSFGSRLGKVIPLNGKGAN